MGECSWVGYEHQGRVGRSQPPFQLMEPCKIEWCGLPQAILREGLLQRALSGQSGRGDKSDSFQAYPSQAGQDSLYQITISIII